MTIQKIKIFVPGGRLATEGLYQLVALCKQVEVSHFQFGRRQEIIVALEESKVNYFIENLAGFDFDINNNGYNKHNIVTSYLAENICSSNYWLRGSDFLDVLDNIDWTPTIRINISDLKQDLVYSFTGDINFIPSEEKYFWHIYLRNRMGGDLFYWPFTIHSEDIHRLVRAYESIHKIEEVSLNEKIQLLHNKLHDRLNPVTMDPRMKVAEFFNYEGIHSYGENKHWVGIYKRETRFEISELEAIASLARQHMIGHLFVTPWKSLIIKDIQDAQITDWKLLLAENGINIGHSYAELNWQINDFDDEAHKLKAFIRKELVANDISSNGVIVGINNDKNYSFSHVIIEKSPFLKKVGKDELTTYTIYVRREFNPTYSDFIVFRKWVLKDSLVNILKMVFKEYYEKAYREFATFTAIKLEKKQPEPETFSVEEKNIFQCRFCQTVYFEEYGDATQHIEPHTPFAQLPDTYRCPTCDAPKSDFEEIEKTNLEILLS